MSTRTCLCFTGLNPSSHSSHGSRHTPIRLVAGFFLLDSHQTEKLLALTLCYPELLTERKNERKHPAQFFSGPDFCQHLNYGTRQVVVKLALQYLGYKHEFNS